MALMKVDLRLAMQEEIEIGIDSAVESTLWSLSDSMPQVEAKLVQTARSSVEVRSESVQTNSELAGLRAVVESLMEEVAKLTTSPASWPKSAWTKQHRATGVAWRKVRIRAR